jgi:glyoxylase-like metal-dependent hydrolase (beta-lactamase superfamily II)
MKAFWAKITAFFMVIVAFFSGLFSGGDSKPVDPPTEPTTEVITMPTEPITEPTTPTEPSTEPTELSTEPVVTTVGQYGLPALPDAAEPGVYQSAGSTEIVRYENTTAEDFSSYRQTLLGAGYTVYDARSIENNQFATLISDALTVTLSWFANTKTMRIIAEARGALCPLQDDCEAVCDTLLTGIKGETCVAAEGMGYIIRLCDGSFVIIDGGMGDPDSVDSNKLMGILNAQKPGGTDKPVIAAWIFTHLHGDHIGVFNCFSLDHHDDVVIERLMFNFPKEEEIPDSDSPYMLDDTIYRYTRFKQNLRDFYADVPVVKLHSGNRFAVRNAQFEVLYAYDDLYPQTILDGGMNENSLLLKMTVGGQTTLWTGDFAYLASALVVREYSEDTLACDILQMAHHGWNGTVALYSAVNPTYALLPVSFRVDMNDMLSTAPNAWLRDSQKVQQFIVTYYGTWTIKLPYAPAPGSFERIPTAETVYPSYPDLLGG